MYANTSVDADRDVDLVGYHEDGSTGETSYDSIFFMSRVQEMVL